MTAAALYYPYLGIDNPQFLFESLLYWDRLACIVPYEEFRPQGYAAGDLGTEIDLMHERFVTGVAPTDEVKDRVHERLTEVFDSPPPDGWRLTDLAPSEEAVLAMRKVSPDTTRMLEDNGWMRDQDGESGRISKAASGLLLGALAREMASETMPPVTDEDETFKATCNGLLRELHARRGIGITPGGDFYPLDRHLEAEAEIGVALARITKIGITPEGVTPAMFKRLRRLREDQGFDEQRRLFREQVDQYVSELRHGPVIQHPVIHDDWAAKLASDRKALKKELRAAGIKTLTERDGWIATGVAAATGTGAFEAMGEAGHPLFVIGLGLAGYNLGERVLERRREIKENHWTSWLTATSS